MCLPTIYKLIRKNWRVKIIEFNEIFHLEQKGYKKKECMAATSAPYKQNGLWELSIKTEKSNYGLDRLQKKKLTIAYPMNVF